MATRSGEVRVWAKLTGCVEKSPVRISVESNHQIFDIIEKTLEMCLKKKFHEGTVSPDMVLVVFEGAEVRSDALVSDYTTTATNPLLLQIEEEEGPVKKKQRSYQQASLNMSASLFGKGGEMWDTKVHEAPLYSHWFAIDLYNSFKCLEQNLDADLPPFDKPPRRDLDFVQDQFNTIASIPEKRPDVGRGIMCNRELMTCEPTLSALYARALDRFLFSDAKRDIGACLHQLPVKREGQFIERPDLSVVRLRNNGLPYEPIALSDIKLSESDHNKAIKETDGYSIKVATVRNEENSLTVHIGIALSGRIIELLLLVGDDGFIREIKICQTTLGGNLKPFFATLFQAVHYSINSPEDLLRVQSGMEPKKDAGLSVLDHHNLRNSHVFLSADMQTVLKLYDVNDDHERSHNYEIIQSIGKCYLPKLSLTDWTTDKRVTCLSYEYIKGTHRPKNVRQFTVITKDLQKLHASGYVHGDIRAVNLVFGESDDEAKMIDFDLAGRANETRYPGRYCHENIEERHPTARAHMPRQYVHDTHALSVVIRKSCPHIDTEQIRETLIACDYVAAIHLLLAC